MPMYHYPPPPPPPPEDPAIKTARLAAIMRDDLVEHCHRPSFKIFRSQDSYIMTKAEVVAEIVQNAKGAHQQIHVPQTSRKRRMSAHAVIMQQPFVEKPRGPALHGLDVGQLTENKSNETTFDMKAQSTGWFHLLLSIDGQLLPGFHAGTIARLGAGPFAGLIFAIRDGARPVPFVDLIVPLDHILDVVTLNSIDADGIKSLATLRAINAMNLSELGNHVKGSDILGEKLKGVDLSVPVNLVHLVAKKVRHLGIDIDWSKVFVIDNLDFKRNFKLHPSTMQDIASAVSSQLKKKGNAFLEAWFFQEETFDRSWPEIFTNLKQYSYTGSHSRPQYQLGNGSSSRWLQISPVQRHTPRTYLCTSFRVCPQYCISQREDLVRCHLRLE
ncbi:hypothetical protein FOFC_16851 [Fusarium oxysporum]|nr:hypothetical protein FOFC_16851 [Fusarium oxysporum]